MAIGFKPLRRLLHNGYWWNCGDLVQRIKWISKHIKKNSK